MKTLLTICILTLELAGCGLMPDRPAKWVNPSKPQSQIKSDHRECAIEAWKQYPKKEGMVKVADGYWELGRNATSTCQYNKYLKNTYCTYTPAIEREWINAKYAMGDENNEARSHWYGNCMITKDPQYTCVKGFSTLDGSRCGRYVE